MGNLKTTERLLEMIDLLGGGRVWSVAEMAARFETTERTIYRDLARLEELRVPIVRWNGGYRLTPDARMRPLALTTEERAILAVALQNPALRTNELRTCRVGRIAAKLSALESLEAPASEMLAGPERTGVVSAEVLHAIESSIDQGRPLAIDYVSLSSGRRERTVDPWRLVHREGVWYLAGRCHEHDELRFFRADRIESARALDHTFVRPGLARLEETLARSWSIYQGETIWPIVIRFDPELAPLVEHGRHHVGETIERLETDEIEYRLELSHLDEIARWVLAFGGRARAIAPDELRHRVEELASGALEVHRKRRGPQRAEKKHAPSDQSAKSGVRPVRRV